jgi:hypothetical protein
MATINLTYKLLLLIITGYFFIGPNNSYSVLLPESTKLVKIDTISQGSINHTFVGKGKNNLDYSLSFSVVTGKKRKLEDIKTIETYEKDCDCKVYKTDRFKFSNFEGIRYSITKKVDNMELAGEVYISNFDKEKSINIVSMMLFENKDLININLTPILESLVLNGDSTD